MESSRTAAAAYRDAISLAQGLTDNQYRTVTDRVTNTTWYEMALRKGKTMIFDMGDLDLLTPYPIHVLKSHARYYATMTIENKKHRVHIHLTGWTFVHHIDGDSLNNRRSNLQESTPLLNNRDRLIRPRSNTGITGVCLARAMKCGKVFYTYYAYIGEHDEEKKRVAYFSVTKLGKTEALRQAVEWRKAQEAALGYTFRESTMRKRGPDDNTTADATNPRFPLDWQDIPD